MVVVIDTNLLNNDYLFRNAQLRVILGEQRLGYEVAISEATLFEHAKHYIGERRGAAKIMRKLDGDAKAFEEIQGEQARRLLKRRAKAAGLRLLPLPKVSHEVVLGRAQHGHRPFTQDGHTGYSDTLIWESVKVIAAADDVVLLSNDGDFGSEGLDAVLESESKPLARKVSKLRSYRDFISEYIDPKRKVIAKIQQDLLDGSAGEKRALLEHAAALALANHSVSPRDAGLETHYSRVDFGPPKLPLDIKSIEVRPLGDKQLHVRVVFVAEAPAIAEYWFQDNPHEDPDSVERDWDEIEARVLVDADAVVAADLASVESVTITSIEQAGPRERDQHGE